MEIDSVTNQFRAAAIHIVLLKAPELFFKLIERLDSAPFLLSEVFGRLLASGSLLSTVLVAVASSLVTKPRSHGAEVLHIVADALIGLRTIGATFEARIPLFLFLVELAQNSKTKDDVITSKLFVDTLCRFLCETALAPRILLVLKHALISIPTSHRQIQLEHVVSGLLTASRTFPGLLMDVFDIIVDVLREKPFLVPQFGRCLQPLIRQLEIKPTPQTLHNALHLIGHSCHSDPQFSLSPRILGILLMRVTESDYPL
jgi:hypothetical protein